jgi:hypothetical protein
MPLAGIFSTVTFPMLDGVFTRRKDRSADYLLAKATQKLQTKPMTTSTANERSSGLGFITTLLGAWMVISPFALGFAHDSAGIANNVAVGIAIIFLSLAGRKNGLLRALNVMIAAWLYASAFILGVPHKAFLWNNLILAVAVVLSAVISEA